MKIAIPGGRRWAVWLLSPSEAAAFPPPDVAHDFGSPGHTALVLGGTPRLATKSAATAAWPRGQWPAGNALIGPQGDQGPVGGGTAVGYASAHVGVVGETFVYNRYLYRYTVAGAMGTTRPDLTRCEQVNPDRAGVMATVDPALGSTTQNVGLAGRGLYLRVYTAGIISGITLDVADTAAGAHIAVNALAATAAGPTGAPGASLGTSGSVDASALSGPTAVAFTATAQVLAGDYLHVAADTLSILLRACSSSSAGSILNTGRAYYDGGSFTPSPNNPTVSPGFDKGLILVGTPA